MSLEQAVEYALEQEGRSPRASRIGPYAAGLSAREAEVLCLVAAGLTNAEIATGALHQLPHRRLARGSIYRKLGLHSRTEATRFAAEHGLL